MTGKNDRNREDLFPDGADDGGDQENEVVVVDKETDSSLDTWLDKNNPEHLAATSTLYKYDFLVGEQRTQMYRWKGEPVPSEHEIGMKFGSGRYYMITVVPEGRKQPKKVYPKRFKLGTEYDVLKRKNDEAEAAKARPSTALAVQSPEDNFIRMYGMVQGIMKDVFALFTPLITRALEPSAPSTAQPSMSDQFGMFGALKNVMKDNVRDNLSFFSEMQRKITSMNPEEIGNGFDQAEPEQKQSILEKLFGMLEPFIPLFIQNTAQAKLAAAGMRALPQVQGVIKQVTARPDVTKHLVNQIAGKYGKQEAVNFLANAGMKQEEISRYISPPAPNTARQPAAASKKGAVRKG
jgi:hypothetical protein